MRARAWPQRAAVAAAVVTLVAVTLAPASIAQNDDQVRLDLEHGYGGNARAYASNPVRIVFETTSFFKGAVEVEIPSERTQRGPTFSFPVEAPAGSRRELTLVIPQASITEVRAVSGSRAHTVVRPSNEGVLRSGELLIGVLAAQPPRVRDVALPLYERRAEVVRVPEAFLRLGASALRPLSHLVTDPAYLHGFGASAVAAVQNFVLEGGELVLAAPTEAELAPLPAAWRGGGTGLRRTAVGDGAVTVVPTALADARWAADGPTWARAIAPTDVARWRESAESEAWISALSQSGGFRRPGLGWLLTFVVAFVLIVGPINFIVLGRLRRRELAWVTVPVVAVLFGAAAYWLGTGFRDVPILQGVAIAKLDSDGTRAAATLGVMSRNGGRERLELPARWLFDPLGTVGHQGRPAVVRRTPSGTVADFDLSIGEVATTAVRAVLPRTTQRAGILRFTGAVYEGRVRNTSPYELIAPQVWAGAVGQPIDRARLGPGQTAVARVGSQDGRGVADGPFGFGGPDHTRTPYSLLALARDYGLGTHGRAFLTGWVDLAPLGRDLGLGRVPGRALVLLPLDLERFDRAVFPASAARAEILEITDERGRGAGRGFTAKGALVRFWVPEGTRPEALRVRTAARGAFRGGPVPAPLPPGGVVVIEPELQPDRPLRVGNAAGISVNFYDATARAWHLSRIVPGGAGGADVTVNVRRTPGVIGADGSVIVRISSAFPIFFEPGMLTLEGVRA